MSQTTRRNGNLSVPPNKSSSDSSSSPPARSKAEYTGRPSPQLLLTYPIVLILGSLFSILSPSASAPTYSAPLTPGVASEMNVPSAPPTLNYFASKQNIFNLYFVKIGWFWTTLAFILLRLTTSNAVQRRREGSGPQAPVQNHHNLQSLLRYTFMTISWFLTTQWFFGPALIDRSFTSTGGRCVHRSTSSTTSTSTSSEAEAEITITSGLACKAAGGTWHGGHDVSGHFFMLVLSSAFLFLEFYLADRQCQLRSSHPTVSPAAAAEIARHSSEEEKRAVGGWESAPAATARLYTHYFVWLVVALDVWMLLMTAVWFHTLFEKVSGLVLALACVWTVYFLPRFSPRWRVVVDGV